MMTTMEQCKHTEWCGGCQYQEIPYEEQLILKENEVKALLADNDVSPNVFAPIVGSPDRYQYRNKMEYTFGDLVKDGPMTLGMHRKGNFMSIVTVEACQLVHDDFNLILDATLDFCKEYPKYHKKQHTGLLRNLIIRRGVRTNELLVNIVTTGDSGFDEAGFVSMLLALPVTNHVVGILRTINDGVSDAVNCDALKVLYGRDYYMEKILGLDFQVSAFSFFQSNVEAVEALYNEALALIPDVNGKVVFDLFCGTGTITQAMAQKAKTAIGIELVDEAVLSAKENAERNGLANCTFLAGDVFDVLDTITIKPDIIVMDPPRMGIREKALNRIIDYGVDQMIYISCNPKTLVQNLVQLKSKGYQVDYLRPFDNFPFTKHVECIALLSKADMPV
jgi:23S rRNA (uracil1939-C5)-methyltransferase